MGKRGRLAILCLVLMLLVTGCWNYRSLNDLAIVSGIAIDVDEESAEYKLCYEIIDLSANVKTGGPTAVLIESRGKTVFDAARNAKKRLEKKLYFGNTLLLILSEKLAKEGHVAHALDWFLRDAELRETTHMVIAQTPTAADLLRVDGINNALVAFEIEEIVANDNETTASTSSVMMYQAYNVLHTQGVSLALPAFHLATNNNPPAVEANGIAVFKKEMLKGYLTPDESKYYLFAVDSIRGGIITLSTKGTKEHDIAFEISKNETNASAYVQDGQINIQLNIKTSVYLGEAAAKMDFLDEEQIASLEAMAGAVISERTEAVIRKVQAEYQADIFGFGRMVHQQNVALWKQVEGDWEDVFFPSLQVRVVAQVDILNSAYLKTSTKEGL